MLFYIEMSTQRLAKIDKEIEVIKARIAEIGVVRPGSLTRQYKDPKYKTGAYYQISYTHRMRSRSAYLRPENLAALRRETANFKRFKKLVDRWVELALAASQLRTKLGIK